MHLYNKNRKYYSREHQGGERFLLSLFLIILEWPQIYELGVGKQFSNYHPKNKIFTNKKNFLQF